MPLVANTGDDGKQQRPCPQLVAESPPSPILDSNCLLVGTGNQNDKDSYSVLASFGAKFGSDIDGTGRNATGQIAQYFATGLAARELAKNGGAATVALGGAATANANVMSSERMIALMDEPEAEQRLKIRLSRIDISRSSIVQKVAASGDYRALLTKIDGDLGGSDFGDACPLVANAAACSSLIAKAGSLGLTPAEWERAASIAATQQ